MWCVQDGFEGSDNSTDDDAEDGIGWSDRTRRQSELSIGESSVHSSLFGGEHNHIILTIKPMRAT
jgi:hypothetical protein